MDVIAHNPIIFHTERTIYIYILQWVYNVNMILNGNIMLYLGGEGKGIEKTGMVYLFEMLFYIINVV